MSEPAARPSRPGKPARRLLIDLTPLRRSRDLRCLVAGELVSVLGTQLTTVAVPYQVYELTHSSLDVGLVSITQLFPLIAGSLLAGSVVDAMDRRRLLMVAQVLMAGCSAGLAVNADLGTSLWPLFVLPALAAGFSGLDSAGRNAIVPNMVRRSEVSTASAIFQTLFQLGLVAGPALAGLLLAGAGVRFVYWLDVASFGVALVAVFLISPQPAGEGWPPARPALDPRGPQLRPRPAGHPGRLPDRHQRDGVRHAASPVPGARHHVFRRAGVDPRLPLRRARRGRPGRRAHYRLGQPDPAPGPRGHRRGHRLGRRHHRLRAGAVAASALVLLAAAGCADVISAVFRSTIIQLAVPDALRGRLAGLQIAVVTGGPRLGDLEAGAVAAGFGDAVSVVSGGLACIAGALVLARLLPGFRHQRALATGGSVASAEGSLASTDGPLASAEGPLTPAEGESRARRDDIDEAL